MILGQTKENSYEIRNLLDGQRFELEIALNRDTCKTILSTRKMSLLIIHTETIAPELGELFDYLYENAISIPMLLLGEEATRLREQIPVDDSLKCFDKPYPVEEMIRYIRAL